VAFAFASNLQPAGDQWELTAETQTALLRVLYEHEFERIGGPGRVLSGAPGVLDIQPGLLNRPPHEKPLIEAALRECGGRVSGPSGAAARLGVPHTTLESKIKALKINKHRFKGIPRKTVGSSD
jgi:DNA-binding NtrC family response regulator